MTQDAVFLWANLFIYNTAVILLLRKIFGSASLSEALKETDGGAATTTTETKADGSTVQTVTNGKATSSSRVASFIGVVVLAVFLWGLGNVIFYKVGNDTVGEIGTLMESISTFFLAGAALFAPYAFNQLGAAFGRGSAPS